MTAFLVGVLAGLFITYIRERMLSRSSFPFLIYAAQLCLGAVFIMATAVELFW